MKAPSKTPKSHNRAGKHAKGQTGKPSRLSWHTAFISAIQMELMEYRGSLEFIPEFQLTTEPLRIDCVIIKKPKGVVIKKNIADIFREVNLLEYKSPGRNVSVTDFYKVYAYACLYASLKETPITSLTVTFVVGRHPGRLLEHLTDGRGYTVEETGPGIYTVIGDVMPIQIIDNRRLSADDNLWLEGLGKRLDPLEVIRLGDKAAKLPKVLVKPYFYIITRANFEAIEEAMNMSSAAKSLEEVLERTGCYARAEERKSLKIAKKLVNLGYPLDDIAYATELEPEKIRELNKQKFNKP